jgi:putative glutamine amidotransferase
VNSLHGQGIDVPAPGLALEGHAPDGTPEAVSVKGAKRFALGVQWHPEYKPLENDFSTRLFRAFSEAVHGKG